MKYFSKDYVQFFKDLSKNNHKEWFHANKKRYEESVKYPFTSFITALIHELQKKEPEIQVEAKDCLARINRDIRFAKDKTPYNTHMTAFISPKGKKDKSIPGLFLRFAPDMLGIMGGCYAPDKEQLAKIRAAIIKDPKSLHKLIQRKTFKETFKELHGDKMKRIPKDLQEAAGKEPLILYKQFYYMAELKPTLLHSNDLMKEVLQTYRIMKPINDYLKEQILS